jgi:hypothetical protein
MKRLLPITFLLLLIFACQTKEPAYQPSVPNISQKVEAYKSFTLKTDLSKLSPNQKKMLPLLFEVAQIMDNLYWQQAWGDKESLLTRIDNASTRQYVLINYGPWDRLNNNEPFIQGIGPKPKGAGFYPEDMTLAEFEALKDDRKNDQYTVLRRDDEGALNVIPYHEFWSVELEKASALLTQAASLADNASFRKYLKSRAKAITTGHYFESDMDWMEMKDNRIDFVTGPIETYEDALLGNKASFESYLLIKDQEWSARLARFSLLLPGLQATLPVSDEYKSEKPGSDSDLGVYDVIYYAGDCNAGSKTIAINLPNDPQVQLKKGSRKLQLKNSMQAKFENILVPISELLIDSAQQKNIDFDAFFENTMFHEVAHGLGIKNTINGNGSVREALKETTSAIEEGKADILGLYIVSRLSEMGELGEKELMNNYVTFMAGIFRSVRFGAASAHGKANMIRFNYFQEQEAFTRNPQTGCYKVNFEKMKEAMTRLSHDLLVIQGDGDYHQANDLLDTYGVIKPQLQEDLERINASGIPVDIVFEQGPEVLGLQ